MEVFAGHIEGTARRPAGAPVSEGWEDKETEVTGTRSHRQGSAVKNHFCFFTLLQIIFKNTTKISQHYLLL